jgi:hypothetical protein
VRIEPLENPADMESEYTNSRATASKKADIRWIFVGTLIQLIPS